MTISQDFTTDRTEERGSALVSVLLLLMMMSALAAALTVSARTETFIARNHQSAAQARAAAEAGLSHAVQVVITNIAQWRQNGFGSVDEALDALLVGPDGMSGTTGTDADNGSLAALGIPLGTRLGIAGTVQAEYEVVLMDEDDPDRDTPTQVLDDNDVTNDENGDPLDDANRILVIKSVGYAANDTLVVMEAMISPGADLPAILTNDDLEIDNNPIVTGVMGSVHTNGDLSINGNPEISGDVTASGTYDESGNPVIGGTATGGAKDITVPEVRASDYLSLADFILTSDGQLTLPNGAVICDASGNGHACEANYGWEFKDANGWELENDKAQGTYYVEGDVKVEGNPGSETDPVQVTIVTEGSIEINGNPHLTPETPELMFVTDGDLRINGNFEMPIDAPGQMLVHEQLRINGNAEIAGQLVVEDAADIHNLVTENRIQGNPTITYNGGLATGPYQVTSWTLRTRM